MNTQVEQATLFNRILAVTHCGVGVLAGMLFTLCVVTSGHAVPLDFDSMRPGVQSASWPEGSTINVYIPSEIRGQDRTSLETGIRAWDNAVPEVMVAFRTGEPPAGATNFVDVNVVRSVPGEEQGAGSGFARFSSTDDEHGDITRGRIDIERSALGNRDQVTNLGAHEFGHVLGLEDEPRDNGTRGNVMDPDFTEKDPFVSPMQATEPSTAMLVGTGVLALIGWGWNLQKHLVQAS